MCFLLKSVKVHELPMASIGQFPKLRNCCLGLWDDVSVLVLSFYDVQYSEMIAICPLGTVGKKLASTESAVFSIGRL